VLTQIARHEHSALAEIDAAKIQAESILEEAEREVARVEEETTRMLEEEIK